MQSQNYKISEDSVGFGKTQGGADNLKTEQRQADAGIASAGQIGEKALSPLMFLLIISVATISFVVFFGRILNSKATLLGVRLAGSKNQNAK